MSKKNRLVVLCSSKTCLSFLHHRTQQRKISSFFSYLTVEKHRSHLRQCVVKSYVEWLTDPDYEQPTCTLCKHQISPDNAIRLTCLGTCSKTEQSSVFLFSNTLARADVFHPDCLDNYAASFPAHTALAGYTCPTCVVSLFSLSLLAL